VKVEFVLKLLPPPAVRVIEVIAEVLRHKETTAIVIAEALSPLEIIVLLVVVFE
jgi:hypothetical protein